MSGAVRTVSVHSLSLDSPYPHSLRRHAESCEQRLHVAHGPIKLVGISEHHNRHNHRLAIVTRQDNSAASAG